MVGEDSGGLLLRDAVSEVSLFVPSVAIEGGNVSLRCSWAKGTETSVAWAKGSSGLISGSSITINGGSLIINPASRSNAGQYSCTVSNPISAQTATASLTVYYGPDTPQVTKTSSDCVGGGDATVGQTVKLTCTSVSLPPALLSWQYNGNLLTASQVDGGTLNLQVFSTNQSGQYICTARNSITTGSSQQQVNLSVVGTCLSVGAVAGIVVACFVVLILIIIGIILLLRQRNVDRRLRDVTAHQKTNLNNRPPVLPAPQNGHTTSRDIDNGDQPDPPPLNLNMHHLPKNQETTVWHTGQENNQAQNRLNNSNLNTGTIPNNGNPSSGAHPYNGHQNSNSYPHNGLHNSHGLFPQSSQQNPNILIQTGNGEPGSQTVLINLNPLPHTELQHSTTQPHTVQVSLNAPQPPPGQPNQNVTMYNGQQNSVVPQRLANGSQQNLPHAGGAQTRGANILNTAPNALNSTLERQDQDPSGLVQTGYSHPTTHNLTGHRTRTNHPSPELRDRRSNDTRSRSPDPTLGFSPHLRQMPWDRLRGTPAYPNPQMDGNSDSSESQPPTLRDRPSRSDPQRGRSSQIPRQRSPVDAPDMQVRAASGAPWRNVQRETANSPSRVDLSVQRQDLQRNVGEHLHAVPPTNVPQQNTRVSRETHVPQNQATQLPPAATDQIRSQTANLPRTLPLTQAALQLHTTHTPNPFSSRNQQTRATLQNPGPGSRPGQPSQPQPHPAAAQMTQAGQRPPTPPPVLQPAEFRTLPREPLKQPRTLQPVHVPRQPHGQRPPDMHRQPRAIHVSPQRHPGNQHMQANARRHGNVVVQRHPPHTSQVHRSRPRL
ncbi:uncharacterized protein [Salminus brasiliensis]|uniref:uncharacterized protein n=1 Tax=Salminus brasiliensis TaxID=930266 RepID=UPI003B82EDB9